jgi:SAM-dependent methyltransferase
MKYTGEELQLFELASVWRNYIYWKLKKYIKDNTLEIGAGIGGFTSIYSNNLKKVCLTDLDTKHIKILKKRFKYKNMKIVKADIKTIKQNFSTILYMNVLEHIKNDQLEINNAIKKLNPSGNLIMLVPACQELYSEFDKSVGHYRRYEINFFKNLKLKKAKVIKVYYLDAMGYILYYLNYFFKSEEIYPSKFKVFIWDKFFIPLTAIVDFLLNYRKGKNIICIIRKNED